MENSEPQRIQKLIANSGRCSRREAERLIENGSVRVNGKTVSLGDKAFPEDDIFVKNKRLNIQKAPSITVAMNKPKGFLCTNSDPHADRTVFDLLPPDLQRQRMFCAGRLDKDSEGLLILTNDGDLAHQLTHPAGRIVKRYRVLLHREFDKAYIPILLNGIEYDGELLKAEKIIPAPAVGDDHLRRLEVHLHHGKKREVRRLFEAKHYFVKKLVRVQIGGILLKGIPRGGIKPLGKKDIERLLK
ncbi:MAG: pseudouridine synthase [Coraliomargaritaceae bacterium]